MLTKEEIEKAGYTALEKGAWIRIDPTIIPRDWEDVCKAFGMDSECDEVILCVSGYKEIYKEEEDE